jgi:hypothetical protein
MQKLLLRKITLVALTMILMPAIASAGVIIPNVATGNSTGAISPPGTVFATTAKPYTLTAAANYTIDRITNNGLAVPSNNISGSGPWIYVVPLSSSTQTVYAYFKLMPAPPSTTLIASAPANVNAALNTPQIISGGTSTISNLQPGAKAKFKWACNPAVGAIFNPISSSVTSPLAISTSFTANISGAYAATLTLSAPGATSSTANVVINVQSTGLAASNYCLSCHAGSPQANAYATSKHADNVSSSCQGCHNPNLALPHPGQSLAALYQICGTCHFDQSGNVPLHPVDIGVNTCVTCHDPHSTVASLLSGVQSAHYNNISSGTYPASYVTSRATCSDCHYATLTNGIIRHEWAISGHSATKGPAWMTDDFKTRSGCVQCHTTTGFIAYSSGRVTAAWGDAADKTKEVLRCNGCHSDITNGTVRSFAPVSPYLDDTYTNPDVGKSNVCLACHSGTRNGASITTKLAAGAAFTNMSIINPHYMATGGTLYNVAGYQFPGRTYTSDFTRSHRNIDSVDTNNTVMGPCITCHKNAYFDHTFRPTWSTNPLCITCHTAMSDATLADSKAKFANALEVLRAELASKGYVYSTTYPYFSNTNWGEGQAGANSMGAAFNYILLLREPGAYAHSPSYAKQLVLDSIDYLDNGVIDDSVTSTALPSLINAGAISQSVADSLSAYKSNSCTSCHGGPASSHAPMASNAHPAHLAAAYGPGYYLGSTASSCQTCHVNAQHMNGVVDVQAGAGSACAACHAGSPPAWNNASRLACTSCHAAVPAILPNGVAAPYKGNFSSTGHGRFNASNQCTICHDQNSAHISSVLGLNMRLFLPDDNSQCGSCHNDTTARAMSSHVLDKNATPTPGLCKECHDVHGTGNLHMIRTFIKGTAITFTSMSSGFVKTVAPYDGLCQVCHTHTNHYRAGIAESNHPTRNCLSCHTHTGSYAFKPAGACDSCHGYPPVPAGFVGAQGNYTSARLQDYPNGGGAHTVAAHIKKGAKPSEGWTNCTICHGNGSLSPTTHRMVSPLQQANVIIDVDDHFVFNNSLPLDRSKYSGPLNGSNTTGSCSNTSCHMGPSPVWAQ